MLSTSLYSAKCIIAGVTRYASSMRAYTDDEYRGLLSECGFGETEFHPSMDGDADELESGLLVITSRKR